MTKGNVQDRLAAMLAEIDCALRAAFDDFKKEEQANLAVAMNDAQVNDADDLSDDVFFECSNRAVDRHLEPLRSLAGLREFIGCHLPGGAPPLAWLDDMRNAPSEQAVVDTLRGRAAGFRMERVIGTVEQPSTAGEDPLDRYLLIEEETGLPVPRPGRCIFCTDLAR